MAKHDSILSGTLHGDLPDNLCRDIIESSRDNIKIVSEAGLIVYLNRSGQKRLGISDPDYWLNQPYHHFWAPPYREMAQKALRLAQRGRKATFTGFRTTEDGEPVWWDVSVSPVRQGRKKRGFYLVVSRDITARKLSEESLDLSQKLLKFANRTVSSSALLRRYVKEIKAFMQMEAVGIRLLNEEKNIPYEAYDGFPLAFVSKESSLSIEGDEGMCSRVIRGETDPARPFFTRGGSFFINASTRFLSAVSEKEKGSARLLCHQYEYESMALIPIRKGHRIAGLVHVADVREDRVPAYRLEALEAVALQLGHALERLHNQEDLNKQKATLKQTVTDRTHELSSANLQLTREIDARLEAEQELRESESRYRLLADYATDMISRHSPDGYYLYASPACEEIIGFSPEELAGHYAYEFFHPDDVPAIREYHALGLKRQIDTPLQYRIRHKKGHFVWVETKTRAVRHPVTGEAQSLITVTREVSGRKKMELALRQSQESLRALINASRDWVALFDAQGRFLALNQTVAHAFQLPLDELIGTDSYLLLSEEAAQIRRRKFRRVLETGEPVRFEQPWHKRILDTTLYPVRDEGGAVDRIAVFGKDITPLKEAEEALRASEQKFRSLAEHAPVGIYLTDTRGNCTYVNPKWADMAGMKTDEALGQGWRLGLHPDDREQVFRDWEAMVESRGVWGSEYRFQDRRGKVTWVYGHAAPVLNALGELIGYVGSNVDITHRKRAEDQLEEQKRMLGALLNATTESALLMDLDGNMLALNKRVAQVFGQDVDALTGKNGMDLLPADLAAARWKNIAQVIQEGRPVRFEDQRLGRVIDNHIHPVLGEDGQVVSLAIFGRDITEEVAAREALKASEEKYRLIVENQNDLIVKIDADYKFRFVNAVYCRTFGRKESDLIGKSILDLIHEKDLPSVNASLDTLLQPPHTCRYELQAQTVNGWRWLAWSSRAKVDGNGRIIEIVTVGRDITHRKELEAQLRASQEALASSEMLHRTILESIVDPVILTDEAGRFTFICSNVMNRLKYTGEELFGMGTVWNLLDSDGFLQKHGGTGNLVENVEVTIPDKLGDVHVFILTMKRVAIEEGRLLFTLHDITELKRAESALRASEARLQSILKYTPTIVYLKDMQGRYQFINAQCEKTFGLRNSEVQGKTLYEVFPDDLARQFDANDQQVIRQDTPRIVEETYQATDGEHTLLSVQFKIFDTDQNPLGFCGISTDISHLKKTKSSLKRNNRLLDGINRGLSLYLSEQNSETLFQKLLEILLDVSDSPSGFLDEVQHNTDGTVFKRSLALTDISWDRDSKKLYEKLKTRNLEFRNLDNLAGLPAATGELVIANEVSGDARGKGLPPGHPAIHRFMGIPIYFGGELMGVAGMANSDSDYTEEMARFLEPLIYTLGSLIQAARHDRERRDHQIRLQESEAKQRALLNAMPDLMFHIDREGTILDFWAPDGSDLVLDPDRVIGSLITESMPVEASDTILDHARRVIETGRIQVFEYLLPVKKGHQLFEARLTACGEDILAVVRNVTREREMEAQLKESEVRYRSFVEKLPGISFKGDKDYHPEFMHGAVEEITGYSEEMFVSGGIAYNQIIHEEDSERVLSDVVMAHKQKEKIVTREYRIRRRDGEIRWVRDDILLNVDETGEVVGAQGLILDITAQKLAEEAILRSEKRFRTYFEVAPFYMYLVSPDGLILDANPCALSRLGYSRDELVGRSLFETLYAPESREAARNAFSQWHESGILTDVELIIQTRSGEKRNVLLNVAGLKDDEGRVIQSVSFQHDVTEQKIYEKALEQSREDLRSLVANAQTVLEDERMRISREIHDELGQSLTALKMDLYWLNGRMTQEDSAYLEKVRSMLSLLDLTIQTVKKISSGLRPGLLDDLGLIPALEWQGNEFQKHTGIVCEMDFTLDEVALAEDRATAIFRVFQESLTNAARHSGARKVTVFLKEKGGVLNLTIRDNGIGIPPEKIHDSRSMGLMGMRERIHQYGGTLKIRGVKSRGTVVEVNMPLS